MALDAQFVVIGGGLMDPESTTMRSARVTCGSFARRAAPYLWPTQRATLTVVPASLGDLSQAIGAALVALYKARWRKIINNQRSQSAFVSPPRSRVRAIRPIACGAAERS